jgi:hypothetical protein
MKLRLIEDKNNGTLYLQKTKWIFFPFWKGWEYVQEPVIMSDITEEGGVRHVEQVWRKVEFSGEGAIGDLHTYVFKKFLSKKKEEAEQDLQIIEDIDV